MPYCCFVYSLKFQICHIDKRKDIEENKQKKNTREERTFKARRVCNAVPLQKLALRFNLGKECYPKPHTRHQTNQ